jgi:hypothetical protein
MITDEGHPEMIKAHQELLRRLGLALGSGRKKLNQSLLDKMFGIIKEHREQCLVRGVDFPVLVALAIPRLGAIDFKRADLDIASIRMAIVNFTRMHPQATMQEIVAAFRAAYPDLKPDDVLSGHDKGIKANERMFERVKQNLADSKDEEPT